MNVLALDYGTKKVGLAYSLNGIIFTLPSMQNDINLIVGIKSIITKNSIEKIYVGLSDGPFAVKTLGFVTMLRAVLKLPVETVEEAVSTIEATEIYFDNQKRKKYLKDNVDSVAAAVILRRVIN